MIIISHILLRKSKNYIEMAARFYRSVSSEFPCKLISHYYYYFFFLSLGLKASGIA